MLSKNFLPAVTFLLLIVNCLVIYALDANASRWARVLSTVILFAILLRQNSYSRRMLSAFCFLFIADSLLFYYENSLVNSATFLARISAYLLLVFAVVPELKNLQTNLFQKMVFVVVFVLNLGMLYLLVDMVPQKFQYPYLNVLFYGYGISMISMVIAAISYSNRYSNKTSFFFTAGTLFLVFSDITSFIAYYLEFDEFYFPDRIFYILGIASLVKFTTFTRDHEAVADLESL